MSAAQQTIGQDASPPREVRTRTARVWLDGAGIIRQVDDTGSEHGLEEARENLLAIATAGRGKRRPLLVDISRVKSISREARTYYATESARLLSAVALVSGSPLSRMMGNFFLGFNRPAIPTRLFSSVEDAADWLQNLLAEGAAGDPR